MFRRITFFFMCVLLSCLFAFMSVRSQAEQNELSVKNKYLSYIMTPELFPYAEIEAARYQNIVMHDDEAKYLEFALFPDQEKVNGGMRTEVSVDYPFQARDVVEYSYQFLIPDKKFKHDVQNRWWVLGAQFHDQPNRDLGEVWNGSPSRSPSISVAYGNVDGQHTLSFLYGADVRHVGYFKVLSDTWYQIRMRIKWSQAADGALDVYIDDDLEPVFSAEGANMHNEYQHFLKLGMYRHPEINTQAAVYIRNVNIQAQ
jgi:hypothetical protein